VQTAAHYTRQFYAPDPTERTASIAGNIATNASGSRSFLYGSTRRHVLGLRVMLMDGRILKVARGDRVDFPVPRIPLPNTTKNTAGYALTPDMDWIFFPSDRAAVDVVEAWRATPGLRMIEYFDSNSLALLGERYPEVPKDSGAALLIEQEHGDIDFWAEHAPEDSWFAASDQDRERFRKFRHALPEIVNDTVRRRGYLKVNSDYAVPLDRNLEMLEHYHQGLRECSLDYVIFGHIGDAHVHVNILPKSESEFKAGQELMLEFARQAVKLGGTVSAEHGLGKRKARLLALQYTLAEIEAMKEVKRRLDPNWLLNRGNLFPVECG
jgi:FAD/FMN-containing dehydrogenase